MSRVGAGPSWGKQRQPAQPVPDNWREQAVALLALPGLDPDDAAALRQVIGWRKPGAAGAALLAELLNRQAAAE
jgi:hypothetical protein